MLPAVQLVIVRHAEAASGEPDDLRPLTAQGREAARALGQRLADEGVRPDAVLTSPLLRARETARRARPTRGRRARARRAARPRAQPPRACARPSQERGDDGGRRRPPAGLRPHRGGAHRRRGAGLPARRAMLAIELRMNAIAVTRTCASRTARTRRCAGSTSRSQRGEVFGLLGPERRRQDDDGRDPRGLPAARRRATVEVLGEDPAAGGPRLARADRRRPPVVGDVPEPDRRREPRALRRLLRAAARRSTR